MKRKMLKVVCMFSCLCLLCGCMSKEVELSESEIQKSTNASENESEKLVKEPSYVLRFDHGLSENDARHVAMEEMARIVEESTNGDVKIEIYTSMQLGTAEDMLEQMREGANVGCMGDAGRLAIYVPEFAACSAPYVVNGYEDVIKLQDSELMQEWRQKLADEFGIVALSWNWCQGFQSAFCVEAAYGSNDFKKMTFRSASAPVYQEMCNTLGATPTSMEFSECYSALQTGLIDGLCMASGNIYSGKIYEVIKFMMETKHLYMYNTPCISAGWFYSLPQEYQDVLMQASIEAGEYYTEMLEKEEEEYRKVFIENGMTIIPPEELDIDGFKERAKDSYEALGVTDTVHEIQTVLAE